MKKQMEKTKNDGDQREFEDKGKKTRRISKLDITDSDGGKSDRVTKEDMGLQNKKRRLSEFDSKPQESKRCLNIETFPLCKNQSSKSEKEDHKTSPGEVTDSVIKSELD
jgi:hypothetical protein